MMVAAVSVKRQFEAFGLKNVNGGGRGARGEGRGESGEGRGGRGEGRSGPVRVAVSFPITNVGNDEWVAHARCYVIPDIFYRESIVVSCACGVLTLPSPLAPPVVPCVCGLLRWIPDYQRRE